MEAREKEELLEALEEVKQLVDTAFPLESGVVRDQVLSMLAAITIQGAMMKQMSPAQMQMDLRQVLDGVRWMFNAYRSIQLEKVAAQLTAVAAQKGKEWAWEAYQEFASKQEKEWAWKAHQEFTGGQEKSQ